jgi:hypothetical protein
VAGRGSGIRDGVNKVFRYPESPVSVTGDSW